MAKGRTITGLDPAASARTGLAAAFAVRAAELWSWKKYIHDPDNVRELHDMRIAAKRLRYLFEFYEPAFGEGFDAELAKFKRLQDYLGDIHDCDVWAGYLLVQLREALREANRGCDAGLDAVLSGGPAHGLLMFIAEIVNRRNVLYDDFLGYWAGLEADGFRDRLTALVTAAVEGADG